MAAPGDWTMTKSASPTTYTAAGQVINYTYVITSHVSTNGNFNPGPPTNGSFTDTKTTVNCPSTSVPANGTVTCTSSYTITAADVTAGSVTNVATVKGDSCGDGCTLGTTATASATVIFVGTPSWTLAKTPSPTTYSAAGQVINYSYLLTNTGNVGISNIAITDNKVTPVSCPATTLAAGAQMTCTGTYSITAADVAATSVTNTATATGTPAGGVLPPATATATINFVGTPGWTLAKTPNPTTYSLPGQVITYTYVLKNTGPIAISAISLTDNKVTTVNCPANTLAAGAQMT